MQKWKAYGESSLTLLAVHCGMDKEEPSIPYDPSDFRRCIHLFECLELSHLEIYCLLCKTACLYPIWVNFVEKWDILTELYNQEKEQEEAPKLYKALQKLGDVKVAISPIDKFFMSENE